MPIFVSNAYIWSISNPSKASRIISSIGFSEFNAIKWIIWGSFIVPFSSFTFIILKNEKWRNKYSFSSWFEDILLIEITDLKLFCSITNFSNNSFNC